MKIGAYSTLRGHKIVFDEDTDEWLYADDMSPTIGSGNRHCGKCGMPPTKDGHDDCIANLPRVLNACCGHGNINEAYVMFQDETIIVGREAAKWSRENKPLPYWHYRGLTGEPAWFSKMHKDVIRERAMRAMKANEGEEIKMRYCHYCEGPLGTMNGNHYALTYINLGRRCPMCGNEAFNTMDLQEGK